MRKVIINADDFGLSPGINRGILEGFGEGILSSTTALVNFPAFEEAAAAARDRKDLAVGVHLTLLWGGPISSPSEVPSLVERSGRFPRSLSVLARRYLLGRLDGQQVRTEFRAQVRRFLDAGLRPTHLDTHKHVHCLPGVLDSVVDVAREFGIDRVRLPVETDLQRPGGPALPRPSLKSVAKRDLIRFLCRNGRDVLRRGGIRTTDHFVGIQHQETLNSEVFARILSCLHEGVTEIMCHPGYEDGPSREYGSAPPHRELELAGLKSDAARRALASADVKLIDYRGL